jgi:hypothetical protein
MSEENLDKLKLQLFRVESLKLVLRVWRTGHKARHCNLGLKCIYRVDGDLGRLDSTAVPPLFCYVHVHVHDLHWKDFLGTE